MSIEEASKEIGQFGRVRARLYRKGEKKGEPIEIWGWLKEHDNKNVLFVDNHDHLFIFKMKDCEFKPAKFKILNQN